jgi:FkbM family methyltransferase
MNEPIGGTKLTLPVPGTSKTAEVHVITAVRSPYGVIQDYISAQVIEDGRFFEEHEVEAIVRLLAPGDLFVDIGANIGLFTAAARAAGAETISIEPQEVCMKSLKKNAGKGEVVQAACGTKKDAMPVYDSYMRHPKRGAIMANIGASSVVSDFGRRDSGKKAEFLTLDEIVGRRNPKVIKIDVEGAEIDVLRSGEKVLERAKPVLFLEQNHGTELAVCANFLKRFGYRVAEVLGDENTSTVVRYEA